ncbi:MAG: endonuclease NucS [Acidimicrobiia bacterium]|nr:endonuclease NucS [Acidimicrobiia bacterium]MBT8217892.1 endonuclease NucS [Acidimicrobiia bacterium]NNF09232.1 endonuclease NucS [Acidimicrobiia bacterium]NNL71137.1 endonuclease NucS [Acidimicrobiia bacterium]
MRVVIADCSVDYEGRLSAHLPEATRLIMVKADGCVAIHADGGAYKPLNWMNAPNTLIEEEGRWVVTNPKGEQLTITLHEVHSDVLHDLGQDPGLEKDGVEAQLQKLLAERVEVLEPGLTLVRREYPTTVGPVDLLCRAEDGGAVAVEIKRKGGIDGVEQLTRYLDFLSRDTRFPSVRGMFVALDVVPQARALAADRGITWLEVDYDELRGVESSHLKLF